MAKGRKGIGPPVMADEPSLTDQAQAAGERPEFSAPEPRERTASASKVVRIPIDEAGRINWDSMRKNTKEEVRVFVESMLKDRELAASFGIDKPLVDVFPAEWTGALYDALGQFEVALAPKLFGVSHEIAASVFPFTAAEKERLGKPTSAVINKYAADWMVRFKEEIALAMLLASITYAKVMAAKMAQTVLNMRTAAATKKPPNGAEQTEQPVAA